MFLWKCFVVINMHMTITMFVFKHMTEDICASHMDAGWNSKIIIVANIIQMTISHESLSFRYHISMSILHANFVYDL